MDVDLSKLFKKFNDPDTKARYFNELMINTLVLEDSDGKKYNVIKIGERCLPWFLAAPGGRGFQDIDNYSYRDDDIFIVTFPKTGTHWIANIVNCLGRGKDFTNKASLSPSILEIMSYDSVEAMKSPRVLSTHQLPQSIPEAALMKKRKLILVFRNPKDTALSMFEHFRRGVMGCSNKMEINWDCFIDNFMIGNMPPCSFHYFYNTWQQFIEEHKDLDILVVHYEDLIKNSLEEIRRIQNYLGLNHSDETLQQILVKCSLENLRSDVNNKRIYSNLVDEDGKSVIYRKGVVGDWRNKFTESQSAKMNALSEAEFKDSIFSWRHEV